MSTADFIFSIDVDAHLKKAASHTFGSPAHYPVELVRAALRRGASRIDIQVERHRIEITDNGSGMDEASLETLLCLMDHSKPVQVKEAAVEEMQNREGIGLLAIFACNPDEILLENVSKPGPVVRSTTIHFKNRKIRQEMFCSIEEGTRVIITGSHRDYLQEKHLLEVFCSSVPREIKLNRELIGNQPLLANQMAVLKIAPSSIVMGGQIGIPLNGAVCHLKLLDKAIPWHHLALPPQEGFIFDAAVEYTGEVTTELIKHLCEYARHLYNWLCDRYTSTMVSNQERIEELIFTHCRLTADESFLKRFSPFRVFNSNRFLNLAQVREKVLAGPLFAVPRRKERIRYITGNKTVLSLPREQADLLINSLGIPVTFLDPATHRSNPFPRWWNRLKKFYRKCILFLLPFPARVVESGQLTREEQMLMMGILRDISGVNVYMVESRGPFVSVVVPPGPGKKSLAPNEKEKARIYIRRQHPLVKKAVKAILIDPRNVEIFVPLIYL